MSSNQRLQQPEPYTPTFKDQVREVNNDVQPIGVMVEEPTPSGDCTSKGTRGLQHDGTGDDDQVLMVAARLVSDEEIVQEQQLDTTKMTVKDASNLSNTKTTSSVGGKSFSGMSKRTKLAIVTLLVIVAAIVGVVVAITRSSSEEQQQDEVPFFLQVGDSMDGKVRDTYLGTALALSETGHRMVTASATAVQVYEFISDEWQQIGQDIVITNSTTTGTHFNLQDPGLMAIAADSTVDYLVIGYGEGGSAEQGMVSVYEYVDPFNSWNLAGTPMFGAAAGSRFGTAVDMNADGNVIAVGAPGQNGSPGLINIYQRDSNGEWGQRGDAIVGDTATTVVSELGRSVSLSASGDRVAAGARTMPDAAESYSLSMVVIEVYEYNLFGDLKWTALGDGINGGSLTTSTGWYVDLSDAGDVMVVSNAYLQEADFVNINPDDLVVQAYQWVNGDWEQLGGNLHAGIEGPKSGFVVSLSGDGLTIGMGDSGTSTGGRGRGHAHIYKFIDNDWMQVGPNIMGQADGDSFGFSVALSGDGTRFAAGAPYNRAAGSDTGRVRVFEL